MFFFVVSDVVADNFIKAKIDFTNLGNIQVLCYDDKHAITESKEKQTRLDGEPRETAHPPASPNTTEMIVKFSSK